MSVAGEVTNDFEMEATNVEENKGLEETNVTSAAGQAEVESATSSETLINSLNNQDILVLPLELQAIEEKDANMTNHFAVEAVVAEDTTQKMFDETTIGTENLFIGNKPQTLPEVQAIEAEFDLDNFIEFTETTTGTFFKSTNISLEDPETTQRGFKDTDTAANLITETAPTNLSIDQNESFSTEPEIFKEGNTEDTTIRVSATHTIQETTSRQIIPLEEFLHKYNQNGELDGKENTWPTKDPEENKEIENPRFKAAIKEDLGIVQVKLLTIIIILQWASKV
jgi:hypothetical protein